MKLTKIIAAVKGRYIVTGRMDGVTWVSDGYAAYPLYGMPRMTKDMMLTLMETPEKDRDAVSFVDGMDVRNTIFDTSFEDNVDDERELLPVNLQIVVMGITLVPMMSEGNIVFVDQRYLKPFASDKRDYRYYLRFDKNGAAYVAVKDGYFLKGVVYPSPAIDVADRISEMAKCIVVDGDDEVALQERMEEA